MGFSWFLPVAVLWVSFLSTNIGGTTTATTSFSIQEKITSPQLYETRMSFFFQDVGKGPNATFAIITGIPGQVWDFLNFGTVFVTDDPITVGYDKDSAQVARGQGIYVTSAMDGSVAQVLISISFTTGGYNGSTIELKGSDRQLDQVSEVAVVGGTGKFRFAKGYATFQTLHFDASIGYSIIQCSVTVQHY